MLENKPRPKGTNDPVSFKQGSNMVQKRFKMFATVCFIVSMCDSKNVLLI
jgi:hypothetical protein